MVNEMMPIGRDFYLSRIPAGGERETITHHRVIDPGRFLSAQREAEKAIVDSGRKAVADELRAATESEYRAANGLQPIARKG